jgi:hypothetical protein
MSIAEKPRLERADREITPITEFPMIGADKIN